MNPRRVRRVRPGMTATDRRRIMDSHTLDLLEFDKVRDLIAASTATSLGRDLARRIEPGTDIHVIRTELALTGEMIEALGAGLSPPFGGIHDVRLIARRAAIGTALTAEQLLEVAETLTATGAVYRYRSRLDERLAGVIELLSGVEDLGAVAKTIGGCIDGRGHVLDMASRELGVVRQKLYDLDERVKAEVRRLLRDPELRKILSYPNATVNGDHYVLPVAANYRHKVSGVVHRVSGTGETLFIEPASVANLSAERAALKAEEDREVRKILRRLSGEVGRVSKPLTYSLEVIGKLDLLTAKAKLARDYDMYPPMMNDDGKLWLRSARHPLLAHLFRTQNQNLPPDDPKRRTVVPIDVRIGFGFDLLVITGPNTGGKTVTLKTTGLLCLMAQSGIPIPAGEGSTVPIFRHVLADIGDEQSLEQSLSTFSSHITRIASIFRTATPDSLILLDELGAGTDPTEGAALGRAILDQLTHVGCRAIVTTHLGDLKTYAFNNERAENGAVEFDTDTLRPTYRLFIGQYGMSNALQIARRLKLPKELLKRAHKYLKRRKGKTGELARLQELRAEAEQAKVAALTAEHEASVQKQEYERKVAAITAEAERDVELRQWREALKPTAKVWVSRFSQFGSVVKVDAKKQTASVSLGLGQWEVPFGEVFPESQD